ncbi:MAG: hypothetical protein HC812_06700 [Leptolyngbya sp. RL_3_1]|nr:hypothetical protein [Leptolyngbya sp. RL_3_1]
MTFIFPSALLAIAVQLVPQPALLLATNLLQSHPSTPLVCPLSQSIYRDSNGQGFELVWRAETTNFSASKATLQISRGDELLHHLDLTQASGYGTISLSSLDLEQTQVATVLTLVFFDETLADATPLFFEPDLPAPTYAFIARLGRYDYYQRRGDGLLVGETLWIFDRCQS